VTTGRAVAIQGRRRKSAEISTIDRASLAKLALGDLNKTYFGDM